MAKLLGEYLLELGSITQWQLDDALRQHAELARAGEYRFIGVILLELGFTTPEQVEQALELQRQDRVRDRPHQSA